MKTTVRTQQIGFYSGLMLLSVFMLTTITSCRKKQDTIAIIIVRDLGNTPVENAQVILYGTSSYPPGTPTPTITAYDTAYTNASGEAIFNFNDEYQLGQAGVAVLDIKAGKNGEITEGIIKIEEETTSKETVYLDI